MLERLTHLKELLIADRDALLTGDFSQLSATSSAMNELLVELENSDEPFSSESDALLKEVRKLAARNASLMNAGMEGVKAAKEKIGMIRRATSELNTYNSEGHMENVAPAPGKIEKRA